MWRVQTADDSEAFAGLVQRWQQPIRNLCARMLGDVHRGEDLCQETFARLFARRMDYEPKGKFSTYLWRIALNLCYDELRRRRRHFEVSLDDSRDGGDFSADNLPAEEPSPAVALDRLEQAEEVRRALDQLPEIYRAVLVLRHYQNLRFREIAEVLEIPEGTAKSRMAEGLALLAQRLRRAAGPQSPVDRRINPELMLL